MGNWASYLFETTINVFGVAQSAFYHRNELHWSEIDYYLQVRQVHVDTLNNLREDLRDLYEMDGRKLDNSMIVTTLMLTIGFGFVVEGTFPPAPGPQDQRTWRIVYAVVAALALMCPFWCMLCLIECRRRLDFFMDRFTHKFYEMLKNRVDGFDQDTSSSGSVRTYATGYTQDLPRLWPHLAVGRAFNSVFCKRRAPVRNGSRRDIEVVDEEGLSPRAMVRASCGDREDGVGKRQKLIRVDMAAALELHNHYMWWWKAWCSGLHTASGFLHWLGILFNTLLCAILLGMNFRTNYPDTPEMWYLYSGLVCLGLSGVAPFLVLALCSGPHAPNVASTYAPSKARYAVDCDERGLPNWMNERAPREKAFSGALCEPLQPAPRI